MTQLFCIVSEQVLYQFTSKAVQQATKVLIRLMGY